MKPAPFAYFRPDTLEEALALLAEHEGAKPLAGGQSLVPGMSFRLARPAALVDLARLPGLDDITAAGEGLSFGAMARQRGIERSAPVAARAPLLAEAMPWVAHWQIRTRGTLGGSLAHADPAAELPAVMTVLDATLRLRGRGGERTVAAAEFSTGLFATVLEPGELLVRIDVPARPARSGEAFMEVARRHGDFALAGIAVRVVLGEDGRCTTARLALMGVGESPVVPSAAQDLLAGSDLSAAVLADAAAAAQRAVDPHTDIHASAAYRRHLTGVLVRRAVAQAARRARTAAA